MDYLYPTILGGILITNLSRVIRTTVINQNHFILLKRLRQNTVYASPETVGNIINGDNDGYFHNLATLESTKKWTVKKV